MDLIPTFVKGNDSYRLVALTCTLLLYYGVFVQLWGLDAYRFGFPYPWRPEPRIVNKVVNSRPQQISTNTTSSRSSSRHCLRCDRLFQSTWQSVCRFNGSGPSGVPCAISIAPGASWRPPRLSFFLHPLDSSQEPSLLPRACHLRILLCASHLTHLRSQTKPAVLQDVSPRLTRLVWAQ